MKIPNKYEILNALITGALTALIIVFGNTLANGIFILVFMVVSIRFIQPGALVLSEYIDTDYSKLLNTISWSFIVGGIYYVDNYVHPIINAYKGAGIMLLALFSYFILVRGIFYLLNKEEPIYEDFHWNRGEFVKARKRNLNSQDTQFTNSIRIGYTIILIVLLNIL